MYLLGHSESANNLLDEQLGNCAGRYWESFHPFGEVVCNDDYVFISGLREGKWSQYIKSNALHGESNDVFPHWYFDLFLGASLLCTQVTVVTPILHIFLILDPIKSLSNMTQGLRPSKVSSCVSIMELLQYFLPKRPWESELLQCHLLKEFPKAGTELRQRLAFELCGATSSQIGLLLLFPNHSSIGTGLISGSLSWACQSSCADLWTESDWFNGATLGISLSSWIFHCSCDSNLSQCLQASFKHGCLKRASALPCLGLGWCCTVKSYCCRDCIHHAFRTTEV